MEHSQTERVKTLSTNLRSRNFVVDISIIVGITNIKCGLLSKRLFQRAQHGGFTKLLGS